MTKLEKGQDFEIEEVLDIKGFQFKVVLIDAFTGKIVLKQVSPKEVEQLKTEHEKKN
jgi:bifunctional DNA-binding transcriptional regulator/antitoxin component of YhaV-PrlF toxin-antitoxin module